MDLNALKSKASTATEEEIETHVGRIVNAVDTAAEDTTRPRFATLHMFSQMAELVERLVSGTYTGAGLDSLVKKQPLALTAAPSDDSPSDARVSSEQLDKLEALAGAIGSKDLDGFIQLATALFAPFASLSANQRTARANLMTSVADGSFKVRDDGTPVLQAEKDSLEKELAQAKSDLQVAKTAQAQAEQERDDAKAAGPVTPQTIKAATDKAVADTRQAVLKSVSQGIDKMIPFGYKFDPKLVEFPDDAKVVVDLVGKRRKQH